MQTDGRPVVGLTSLSGYLFVLRSPSRQQIQIYDSTTFNEVQSTLEVRSLSDDTDCSSLTSCFTNKCLYVSDYDKDVVYKVQLTGDNEVSSWRVDRWPMGLSVNDAHNVLVSCCDANKIQEYTTCGSLVREISLQLDDVDLCPLHAVQLTSGHFVVSYWNGNSLHDVAEIDADGRVIVSYESKLSSVNEHKFSNPCHLAVDKNNRYILVADCNNNRIVIINPSMKSCARELNVATSGGELIAPSCLCFDESCDRLFVGEFNGQRVLVFDNVLTSVNSCQ